MPKLKTKPWEKMCLFSLDAGSPKNPELEEEAKQKLMDCAKKDGAFDLNDIRFILKRNIKDPVRIGAYDHYIFYLTGKVHS